MKRSKLSNDHDQPLTLPLSAWPEVLSSTLAILRRLAETTESEFLQIGTKMQGIYQKSFTLSETSQQLIEMASGSYVLGLIDRLRRMLHEIENYLEHAQRQSSKSLVMLSQINDFLTQVEKPLLGVRKVSKHLYILEVSIKIESSHLGDIGSDFANLALDINKLTQQIKSKVKAITYHIHSLAHLITSNSKDIQNTTAKQEKQSELMLDNTEASISELASFNERFSDLGNVLSLSSQEYSDNISEIVQSMQFHDIYRQQVEHVIDALEGLKPLFRRNRFDDIPPDDKQDLICKTGDVCELQQAQLQFASTDLHKAVTSILANLQDIGLKQQRMTQDICEQTGTVDDSGSSFVHKISQDMSLITDLLTTSADNNEKVVGIMKEVTDRTHEITNFVSDIEEIGHQIIQIALNARIKAVSTGQGGASLSVLAEEIGQLSKETVEQMDMITSTLTDIHSATDNFSNEVVNKEKEQEEKLIAMKSELNDILSALEEMGGKLFSQLSQAEKQVSALTGRTEQVTSDIDVHERIKVMADDALGKLEQIYCQARSLHPASSAFKDDLRLLAKQYTMESERRVHQEIASRHGGSVAGDQYSPPAGTQDNMSEFGDNVDLF